MILALNSRRIALLAVLLLLTAGEVVFRSSSVVTACSAHADHSHDNDRINSVVQQHRHLQFDGNTTAAVNRSSSNSTNTTNDDDDVVIEECGFTHTDMTPAQLAEEELAMTLWRMERTSVLGRQSTSYEVQIFFHIIQSSRNNNIDVDRIDMYVDYVNAAYETITPFQFRLSGITRTVNSDWARDALDEESVYKPQLYRQEGLNVYIVEKIPNRDGSSLAGYAYLPSDFAGNWRDGVVISATNPTDLNRPNTLVHEIGHWFGLLHTFNSNGVCTDSDGVSDTAIHLLDRSIDCQAPGDSCRSNSGRDPVNNYMTYSGTNHLCRDEFTDGQVERMIFQYERYRGTLTPPTPRPVASPTRRPVSPPSRRPTTSAPVPRPTRRPVAPPPTRRPVAPPPTRQPTTRRPTLAPIILPPTLPTIPPFVFIAFGPQPTTPIVSSESTDEIFVNSSPATCISWLNTCDVDDELSCCVGRCKKILNLGFLPDMCIIYL